MVCFDTGQKVIDPVLVARTDHFILDFLLACPHIRTRESVPQETEHIMRLIAIDTETTGASAARGDRCVEIGAVEMIDGRCTGRVFQTYLNPGRPVAWQAERVHGLSNRFLADKPPFSRVAPDLLAFIGEAPCVAHNARFDCDMILHDFHHAGLQIPPLRFFDSLVFARGQVRAPSFGLDVLARSLGVIEQDRGRHGALEDATILARVLERIEMRSPGAFGRWMRGASPVTSRLNAGQAAPASSGLPLFDCPPVSAPPAPSRPRSAEPAQPVKIISQPRAPARPDPSREQHEADRIAGLVRAALEGSSDLPDFVKRLTDEGVFIRPVINASLALHGMRFSTREASFTGGVIGLTGAKMERAGLVYRDTDHRQLMRRLADRHDRAMGSIVAVKNRFTAVPSRSEDRSEMGSAEVRLRNLVAEALCGASNIREVIDHVEPFGVSVNAQIDHVGKRVRSVSFTLDGTKVRGRDVGLRPRTLPDSFWSLKSGPLASKGRRPSAPDPLPTRIGEGLNEGVAAFIAEVNRGEAEASAETVARMRSGRDGWSRIPEEDLWEIVLDDFAEARLAQAFEIVDDQDRASALRWICRGLLPEFSCQLHRLRRDIMEERLADVPSP